MSIRNFKTSGNFHWFKTGNSLSPYRKKWDSGGGDIIMPLRNVLRIHLTIYWCWLNICVPPKFVIWNPNPHCDGVRKWDLGEMIRSRWSALINGINDLVKETPERLFPSSTVWGPRRKMSLYESGSGPSQYLESVSILILDFLSSKNMRNTFLLLISHLVYVNLLYSFNGWRHLWISSWNGYRVVRIWQDSRAFCSLSLGNCISQRVVYNIAA